MDADATPTRLRPPAPAPAPAPTPTPLPRLEAHDLLVRLGGRPVLDGTTLVVEPGWTALVGPNGAGKSTLLKALAGLLAPERGRVRLHRPADRESAPDLLAWRPAERARRIAWMAQQGGTTGELTVRETVELGRIARLGLAGVPGPADRAAVDRAMAATGCGAWSARPLESLSGGERQRVLLARALATEAPWLLLDEPTTHLDAPHQLALARLIRALVDDRSTPRAVLSVLHDLPVALRADRVAVLDRGRVVAVGPPDDPALHAALGAVFDQAIRIRTGDDGRPRVELAP